MTRIAINQWRLLVGLIVILLLGGGLSQLWPGSVQSIGSREKYELGAVVYAENCAGCHGSSGEGENLDAPLQPGDDGLYPAPPHNDQGHTWHHSDDLLQEIIREGSVVEGFKPMPSFADTLNEDEIEAVLIYIKQWWTVEQRQIQADASERDEN